MKKVLNLFILVCFLAGVAALNSCKKEELPTLTTTAVTSITTVSASSGGNITDDGGAEVTARGICWGTATKPEITGSKTSDSKGIGNFTSSITGLTPNTLYYVRAYATNSEGTAYGNEVSFTTLPVTGAVVTTTAVTSITSTTAVSGGNVTSDGGGSITAKGVCWATTANPDLTKSKTNDGTGTGTFTSNLTGLTPGTLYHVRAYATNSSGTTYGADVQFTSLAVLPTVTTTAVTAVTQTTAATGGNVTANGGGAVTAKGVCYGTTTAPGIGGPHTTDGTGNGAFTSNLTGLTPGTVYYVRAYATNSAGTAYGSQETFTTGAVLLPTVTTAAVTSITNNSAVSGGNVSADGGGAITARGVCWGTTPAPVATGSHTTETGTTGSFVSTMTSLSEATLFYVRAYATNSAGTAYGTELTFRTFLSDGSGNLYNTVVIGTQVWMVENLRTTKYNDNITDIPTVITGIGSGAAWAALTTPGYCWYNNDEATNKPLYGALYNWYAVNTGNLCPTGFRVPTDADFKTLEIYLGMTPVQADATGWRGTDQGTVLKNTTGWDNNGNGTNTTGFSAMPGGVRYYEDGSFFDEGILGYWWSQTAGSPSTGLYRRLNGDQTGVHREGAGKAAGKSVRCLK
jgi:uncharacterized protein (TIGR02145 family)